MNLTSIMYAECKNYEWIYVCWNKTKICCDFFYVVNLSRRCICLFSERRVTLYRMQNFHLYSNTISLFPFFTQSCIAWFVVILISSTSLILKHSRRLELHTQYMYIHLEISWNNVVRQHGILCRQTAASTM